MRKQLCHTLLLLAVMVLSLSAGCEENAGTDATRRAARAKATAYASYRDIPGVTEEEIQAIEAFRSREKPFVYGMVFGRETFVDNDGEVAGFSALFCDWLTSLFGYRFEPTLYHWDELIQGVSGQSIDFSGDFSKTTKRLKTFFMTDPIASRTIRCMRIVGSEPLSEIAKKRPLRYVFLKNSSVYDKVSPFIREKYQPIFVNDSTLAYSALISERGDAFFNENSSEATFDVYGGVEAKDFYPLVYTHVSLTTANPSLAPFISVMQKALKQGVITHLNDLYNSGMRDYLRYKFSSKLTRVERNYVSRRIASRLGVPFIAEYSNYPISFYNTHEKKWQGIAFDVLSEISALTGLVFVRTNDEKMRMPEAVEKLSSGEAAMMTELIQSDERAEKFIWADVALAQDYYALLSRENHRNIQLNEILQAKIGLIKGGAYTEVFNIWFPHHTNTVEYNSIEDAFVGLDRGDIDMIMATQNMLLIKTNYLEQPGYKVNVLFNQTCDSTFVFNGNEAVLASVMNKAMALIDVGSVAAPWMRKTFDYRDKMVRARRPWLAGIAALLICAFCLLSVLLHNRKRESARLIQLVHERTSELKAQTEATKEADERIRAMLDSAPLTCSLWSEAGVMLDCNLATLRFFGISSKSDYMGRFFELNPEYQPDGTPTVEKKNKLIASALEKGYERFEWMFQGVNGEPLPVETTLVRLQWQGGLRIAAYSRDLREIRKAEENIARMSAIVEVLPQFVLCASPLGAIEYVNQSAADISGYSREEIFAQGLGLMFDEDVIRQLNEEHMSAVAGGKRITTENILNCKNGEKRVLSMSLFPIVFNDGEVGVGMAAKDITDIKQMYMDLLESKERAERALLLESKGGGANPVKTSELEQIDCIVDYITKDICLSGDVQ